MKRLPLFVFIVSLISVLFSQTAYSQTSKKRDQPVADFSFTPDVACIGDTVHFINKSSGNVLSKWDFGDDIDAITTSNSAQLIHIYHKAGAQALINLTVISWDNQSAKKSRVIRVEPLPVVTIDQENEVTVLDGDSLNVTASAIGSNEFYWFNDKGDTVSKKANAYLKTEGTYTVKAITEQFRCKNTTTINVKIKLRPTSADGETIEVNNIITPNNDGYNDYLTVKNLEYYSNPCDIRIYNVWGDLVFSNSKYDNKWSGSNLDAGTYYYSITSKGRKGSIGFVNIIR